MYASTSRQANNRVAVGRGRGNKGMREQRNREEYDPRFVLPIQPAHERDRQVSVATFSLSQGAAVFGDGMAASTRGRRSRKILEAKKQAAWGAGSLPGRTLLLDPCGELGPGLQTEPLEDLVYVCLDRAL